MSQGSYKKISEMSASELLDKIVSLTSLLQMLKKKYNEKVMEDLKNEEQAKSKV